MPKTRAQKKDPNALTPKEELFCSEYCANGFNATKAFKAAGYSAKTADPNSARLIAKDRIKKRIENLKAKASEKNEVKISDIVARLRSIGLEMKPDDHLKYSDILKANELLGRWLKMFSDAPLVDPNRQTTVIILPSNGFESRKKN